MLNQKKQHSVNKTQGTLKRIKPKTYLKINKSYSINTTTEKRAKLHEVRGPIYK